MIIILILNKGVDVKKLILFFLVITTSVFARSVTIDVVEHKPIYETREVTKTINSCDDENYNILGTIAGAAAGGIIGHQIGGGSGKKIATVAGVLGGGYAGNRVENTIRNDNCTYENKVVEENVLIGYKNIGYYNGKEYSKITEEKQSHISVEVD
ncbi:MAG: glycine zipper 2TM domain-containing protein [Campylobacter sp.]|nr:glycine zipper 2TM domain-containing protein [Campylobacter sp.]